MPAAFSTLLQCSVGTAELRAMPVSGIPLARKLYQHAQETSLQVEALVREHAAGLHQTRELSLRLYDGYNLQDGIKRPLEVSARAELPAALRSLTDDFSARRELTRLQVPGQDSATRRKTGRCALPTPRPSTPGRPARARTRCAASCGWRWRWRWRWR